MIAPEFIVPAAVTLAPLKVNAVVVPDLIIKLPEVFVALPKVVPASLKNISPPSASKTMSVVASNVIVEPLSISAIVGVVNVLFVSVCAAVAETKAKPPAVDPSCNLSVSSVVSTLISPTAPVNELFCEVVPLLNCNAVGIVRLSYNQFQFYL